MTKTKQEPEKRTDKMVKPNGNVQSFNFPAHGITIQASSLEEAEDELKNLTSKSKQDD